VADKPRLPDTPFWVEPERVVEDRLRLSSEESHHLLHVFRAGPGTPFQATDGRGAFFECVLESVERRIAVGRILNRREGWGELDRSIQLLVGLPEWRAVEQVVEHAVPLGATAIDFVVCERSGREVLGPQRIARLDRIARAALKQSRRSRLPSLTSSPSLAGAVRELNPGARYYGDPEGHPFSNNSTERPQTPLQLAVGPSGGFTEEERRFLTEAGFSAISLGPSRLTTETACLALISLARNSL
jgi:16S rRNA (uracil1498-N3)-methyltransferase